MNTSEFSATCQSNISSILYHLSHVPPGSVSDRVIRAWGEGGLLEPGYNPDGTLSRLWLNVVAHQIAVARLANKLASHIEIVRSAHNLVQEITEAALVHDAFKRREWEIVEAAKLAGKDPSKANRQAEITNEEFLRGLGFSENVVGFAHATGDIGLELMRTGEPVFGEEIVFYADCCVSNDRIVGYKQRFDDLLPHFQPGGRYEWGNKAFLAKYGRTHRETYDEVVLPLQEKYAGMIRFSDNPTDLFKVAL